MELDTHSTEDEYLYFHVKHITAKDLIDYQGISSPGRRLQYRGHMADVNGRNIALLKYKGKVFAMDEKCPHMGGPLHLGDIEELGEARLPCVVCPWHNWKFSLETGLLKQPLQESVVKVTLYPVRVQENGTIFVGFKSLDKNSFHAVDF